jgi:hypothetical protein
MGSSFMFPISLSPGVVGQHVSQGQAIILGLVPRLTNNDIYFAPHLDCETLASRPRPFPETGEKDVKP